MQLSRTFRFAACPSHARICTRWLLTCRLINYLHWLQIDTLPFQTFGELTSGGSRNFVLRVFEWTREGRAYILRNWAFNLLRFFNSNWYLFYLVSEGILLSLNFKRVILQLNLEYKMIVTGFSRSSVRHTVTRLCVKYYQIGDSLLSNTFSLSFPFWLWKDFKYFTKRWHTEN